MDVQRHDFTRTFLRSKINVNEIDNESPLKVQNYHFKPSHTQCLDSLIGEFTDENLSLFGFIFFLGEIKFDLVRTKYVKV